MKLAHYRNSKMYNRRKNLVKTAYYFKKHILASIGAGLGGSLGQRPVTPDLYHNETTFNKAPPAKKVYRDYKK